MGEPAIHHPNREKAESKATKAIVVLLLIASAALVLIITIGGWSALQGAQGFAFVYAGLNLLFAYYVSRWNRGVLPVAAALAVLYGVLAAISGSSWFARDKEGFADPLLDPAMLGLLTFVLVPVQILLTAFAMRAFSQRWNVEVEDSDHGYGESAPPSGRTAPLNA
jgi:protein-S-isoprenylcysteine O-methyltransferase Ste14